MSDSIKKMTVDDLSDTYSPAELVQAARLALERSSIDDLYFIQEVEATLLLMIGRAVSDRLVYVQNNDIGTYLELMDANFICQEWWKYIYYDIRRKSAVVGVVDAMTDSIVKSFTNDFKGNWPYKAHIDGAIVDNAWNEVIKQVRSVVSALTDSAKANGYKVVGFRASYKKPDDPTSVWTHIKGCPADLYFIFDKVE